MTELKAKLLALGGLTVLAPDHPHLTLLLTQSRPFPTENRRRIQGVRHLSHANAALVYVRHHVLGHPGVCELATGFVLSRRGVWTPLSWAWDGERVMDTNIASAMYFGVVLSPADAARFALVEVGRHLPGGSEAAHAIAA